MFNWFKVKNPIEEEIFRVINEKGYILDNNLSEETRNKLIELRDNGILTDLNKLGIKFINESYFFTYADNRFNLKVKNEGYGISSIIKG